MAGDVIGQAYVEVHARVDNLSRELNGELERAFAGTEVHARRAVKGVERAFGDTDIDNSNFFRKAFTPDPDTFAVLRRPFERALATPIGLAVAGALSQALILSIPAALSLGLGGGLIAVAAFALRGSEVLKKHLGDAGKGISDSLARAAKPLEAPFAEAIDAFAAGIIKLEPQLSRLFSAFADSGAIDAFIQGMLGFVEAVLPSLERAMPSIVASFEALAKNLPGLGAVLASVIGVLTSNSEAIGFTVTALVKLVEVLLRVGQVIVQAVSGPVLVLASVFRRVAASAQVTSELVSSAWTRIRAIVARAVAAVVVAVVGGFSRVRSFVAGAVGGILGAVGALGSLPGRFAAWFGGAANAARTRLGALLSFVAGIPRRIVAALSGLGGLLFGAGVGIIQGLINGIRSAAGSVASAARGVVQGAISAARDALVPGSPSKVFAALGRNAAEGLALGFDQGGRAAADAADRLARSLAPRLPGAGASGRGAFGLAGGGGIHIETLVVQPIGGQFRLADVMTEVRMQGLR